MSMTPYPQTPYTAALWQAELQRRAEWYRNNPPMRTRRIVGGVVCGESDDRWAARICGNTDEARCRRGENNG